MTSFEESMQMSTVYLTNTFSRDVSDAFSNYIEEEEIEEIEKDASASYIVEFMGDKFKWNSKEKHLFFSALQKLFSITITTPIAPSDIDWTNFTDDDIKKTWEYLNKQCSNALCCKDQSLFAIAAVGRNHDISIVPLLYDVYSHYKMYLSHKIYMSTKIQAKLVFRYIQNIEHLLPFYSTRYSIPSQIKSICFAYYNFNPDEQINYRNLTVSKFCEKSKVLHSLKKKERLKKIYYSIVQTLKNSFSSRFSEFAEFLHHLNRSLIWTLDIYLSLKIDDDINIYIQYTLYIANMLDSVIRDNHSCLPLLVDLWIIPRKIKEKSTRWYSSDVDTESDIDDDDTDSDSDSDDYSDYEMKDTLPLNFHEGLKKYNAYYCMDTINHKEEKACRNILKKNFERILNRSRRSIKIGINIDRRKEKNNLLVYQLPLKYSAIPRNYCNETLIYSSGQHLMFDPDNSILRRRRKKGSNIGEEEEKRDPIFGAQFDCDGKMFCLSFSLLETNVNRIQLWRNGGSMRFWPDYMLSIWPKLFIDPKIDERYLQNDYIKNNFKLNVDDKLFDVWYKSIVDWQ